MSNGSLMAKDLKIVSTLKGLVTEKVNLVKVAGIQKLKTVGLVPSRWKDIEGDLTSDTVRQIEVGKFLAHGFHHVFTHIVGEIKDFVVIAFFTGAVAANGRNVKHAASEFNECSALKDESIEESLG